VTAVVPREQVVPAAIERARALTRGTPLAARFAKQSLRLSEELPISGAIEQERALTAVLLSTDDLQEAIAAYFEKRPPRFTGR
jgi:enoyl-CoA hydratase/carnithine racemase